MGEEFFDNDKNYYNYIHGLTKVDFRFSLGADQDAQPTNFHCPASTNKRKREREKIFHRGIQITSL